MRRLLLLASLVACSPRAVPAEKGHPADPATPVAQEPLPPGSVAHDKEQAPGAHQGAEAHDKEQEPGAQQGHHH